jgi:hypothetical protein
VTSGLKKAGPCCGLTPPRQHVCAVRASCSAPQVTESACGQQSTPEHMWRVCRYEHLPSLSVGAATWGYSVSRRNSSCPASTSASVRLEYSIRTAADTGTPGPAHSTGDGVTTHTIHDAHEGSSKVEHAPASAAAKAATALLFNASMSWEVKSASSAASPAALPPPSPTATRSA